MLWLVLLTAAPLMAIVMAAELGPTGEIQGRLLWAVLTAGGLGVAATIWFGGWLAVVRRWRQLLLAPALGAGALVTCYVLAFVVLQPSDPQADNEAGAGIAILTVPALMIVAALLAVGAGSVAALERLRSAKP